MKKMLDYQLIVYPDSKELVRGFCQTLTEKLNKLCAQQTKVHLCLSGGDSPKAVFQLLAREYAAALPWQQVHFYWSDERCVAPEHVESNYGTAKRLLLDPLNIKPDHIHFIDGSKPAEKEALRYAEELSKELPRSGAGQSSIKDGLPDSILEPRFDLLLLGLGQDGHTASIFPHNIDLLKDSRLCLVSEHPTSGQKRISLGGRLLNNAANTWFLISGSSKTEVFKQILQNEAIALNYPAYHIRPAAGNLVYFADKDAAG